HGSLEKSAMILPQTFSGPTSFQDKGNTFETPTLRVTSTPDSCLFFFDKIKGAGLTTLCPDKQQDYWQEMTMDPASTTDLYGVGQYFKNPGSFDGNWAGEVFEPMEHGNGMKWVSGGGPSVAQFPILYALGRGDEGYALLLDQPRKVRWDFKQYWW